MNYILSIVTNTNFKELEIITIIIDEKVREDYIEFLKNDIKNIIFEGKTTIRGDLESYYFVKDFILCSLMEIIPNEG